MLTLSDDELRELTKCKRAGDQLKVLHESGFYRAVIRRGSVVLERAHYEAVCAGRNEPARPKVIPPKLTARGTFA